MNADTAKAASQVYLHDFESEVPTTVSLLRSIPEGTLDYRPDARSRTGLALCRHLVLNDLWFLDGIASGSFRPEPDDSDACGLKAPAGCADRYDREARSSLERIKALSGEDLVRPLELFTYKMPAVAYLSLALRHSIHHRGQLTAYARAMGGTIPPIYGPTADTRNA